MNKTITKNLRKLRQGKRLSQEYVAERLGVSAKAVSRWEKLPLSQKLQSN